jgi:hypothetical protein
MTLSHFKKNNMRFTFLTLLLTAIICHQAVAQSGGDPVAYLESIGNGFADIAQNTMSYTSAASHGKSARKVEKRRSDLMQAIKQAEANVRKMKPFNGDHAFRDSVVSYLRINRIVLSEDYGKILNMEEIAEQSFDAMEAYLLAKEKAHDKLDDAFEKVKEQQELFAKSYNVKLLEGSSKVGRKLETSNKVFAYYNQIYLLFFKSFKNEAYLMDAINKRDINAMEQTKNALLASAEQDLAKIGPMGTYKGDATLKTACQQLLNFYKSECATKIPDLINFYLKKENYEKMKAAMEAKRPTDRTSQDIDTYNKAIDDFNKAVNNLNKDQNELNKKRDESLNKWNDMSEEFLHKHVPKYNG